jgi:hypothetical protein
MSLIPDLLPESYTSYKRLPPTGSYPEVVPSLAFKVYTDETFVTGAVDMVAFTYQRLGGNILNIELEPENVYNCYEQAALKYSFIINNHHAKNILIYALGYSTASFDSQGNVTDGPDISLKYPKFNFPLSRRLGYAYADEKGLGGLTNIYSASFPVENGVQTYNLQQILSESVDFGPIVGNNKVIIRDVYYESPRAQWRFFGYFGGLGSVGGFMNYGQYAGGSTFFLTPTWETKLRAMNYEDAMHVRVSHYSYELKNNKLRIYPIPGPGSPRNMWFRFYIPSDPWADDDNGDSGTNGVSNVNNLPMGNIPFDKINSMGKHWIREYALALCKEVLGNIRGKTDSIPLPKGSVRLNSADLLGQAKEEKEKLEKDFIEWLDKMSYDELQKREKEKLDADMDIKAKIPAGIFMG